MPLSPGSGLTIDGSPTAMFQGIESQMCRELLGRGLFGKALREDKEIGGQQEAHPWN